METVSSELLKEFKDRMHFSHSSEDDNLSRLLSFSITAIKGMIGDRVNVDDLTAVNQMARELVIERTRYAYNEALEYFIENFSRDISTAQLAYALEEIPEDELTEGDADATI